MKRIKRGDEFLENVVIPSSVNTIGDYIFYNYNVNALPALTNVSQIFYKASITSWDAIVKTPNAIDENITIYTYYEDANVFDYLDAEKKGCKIWDYNENNEPEVLSFHITDTFNGKSFGCFQLGRHGVTHGGRVAEVGMKGLRNDG